MQFHALVTRDKPERFVEAKRIRASLIGGELDDTATSFSGSSDRLANEGSTVTTSAGGFRNPYAFNHRPLPPLVREGRDIGDLHDSDQLVVDHRHDQFIVRVSIDQLECTTILGSMVFVGGLSPDSETVVGEQSDETREVVSASGSEYQRHPNIIGGLTLVVGIQAARKTHSRWTKIVSASTHLDDAILRD